MTEITPIPKLLQRLEITKSDSALPIDLMVIFNQFSSKVEQELKQISMLFDEYTPHDDLHINSLFRITEALLGSQIDKLNGCEACILACSIYGHDWGMAISPDEKARIVTGKVPKSKQEKDFALLDDENEKWKSFTKSERITVNSEGFVDDITKITKENWRDYVRQTHAERAKCRVIHYFAGDLSSFGYIVGEVCAGHWYKASEIRRIETQISVVGFIVNLRAIMTYMRFIDLLDLGKNRTPFALWKFINPRNTQSKIEWKKHIALEPMTIDPLHESDSHRYLRFHGNTNDHEVYAALEDLRRYVDSQIKENIDLLKNLIGYELGFITLEWKIAAHGFTPIDLRFEFDRERMFELMSGEIYSGDPYVFIRELIQNSIDATELRCRRYEKEETTLNNQFIKVEIIHKENGDAIIKVTDTGTGMSVETVREYLFTIGRSYYRSKEFQDLDTNMAPISRFGVGLLSCFEVADSIIVETSEDRQFSQPTALHIDISDKSQQFRVKKLASCPTGTTIEVKVLGRKWRNADFMDIKNLQITEYIKTISGFVPYPIHVIEDGVETVICSMKMSDEEYRKLKENFPLATLYKDMGIFSFEETIEAQDLELARHVFELQRFDFFSDLHGINIDGIISFYSPNDEIQYSLQHVRGGHGATFRFYQDGNLVSAPIRWIDTVNGVKPKSISPSAKQLSTCRVYLHGILVPEADLRITAPTGSPPSRITININCGSNEMIPALSRRDFRKPLDLVKESIQVKFNEVIRKLYQEKFEKADSFTKLILMARLSRYVIQHTQIVSCFPVPDWPMVLLQKNGELKTCLFQDLPENIEVAPKSFFQAQKNRAPSWPIEKWLMTELSNANEIVNEHIPMVVTYFGFEREDGAPAEWSEMHSFISQAIRDNYILCGVRTAKQGGVSSLIKQYKKETVILKPQIEKKVLQSFNFEFTPFDPKENSTLGLLIIENDSFHPNSFRRIIFNSSHRAVSLFQKSLIEANEKIKSIDPIVAGQLKDVFYSLPFIGHIYTYKPNVYEQIVVKWVQDFCFAAFKARVCILTEDDRNYLRCNHKAKACYD